MKKYYIGKLCPKKHKYFFDIDGSLRYISNHCCVQCQLIATKKWEKNNPDKVKLDYIRHREKRIQSAKRWKKENRKKVVNNQKKYANKHREYYKNYQKIYQREYYKKIKIYNKKIYGKCFHISRLSLIKQALLIVLSWKILKKEKNQIIYISRNGNMFLKLKYDDTFIYIFKPQKYCKLKKGEKK